MDDQGDRAGTGPASTGPGFVPPSRPAAPPLVAWTPAPPPPVGAPRSRLPAVLTAAAVGIVALVVVLATLVAHHSDTHVAAPVTNPVVVPSPTARPDRIGFSTSTGSGELILVQRSWSDGGNPPPDKGSYLKIAIEIDCLAGRLDYAPPNFQAFNQNGELFELSLDQAEEPVLQTGTLEAGMQTSGHLAFDIPRGDVTLLMSDDLENSVTALRIPA